MTGTAVRHDAASVRAALSEGGSVAAAARILGVSRKTVYEYLRRYSIEVSPPTRTLIA